jgi:hypothetical protein
MFQIELHTDLSYRPNLFSTDIDSTNMVKTEATYYYQWFGVDPPEFERNLCRSKAKRSLDSR